MRGTPSTFIDKGSVMRRTAFQSLIQQNDIIEIVRDTASPGSSFQRNQEDGGKSSTSHSSTPSYRSPTS